MIIVEGPDGAGKTTLVENLSEQLHTPIHERASTSKGGPVDNIYEWAEQDVTTWPVQPFSIYDRHPLISEPIYGSVLRDGYDERFNGRKGAALVNTLASHALVIYCLPSLQTIEANLSGDDNQLAGVEHHANELWANYVRQMHAMGAAFNRPFLFRYDYTKGPQELYDVLGVAIAHRINWKRKYGA